MRIDLKFTLTALALALASGLGLYVYGQSDRWAGLDDAHEERLRDAAVIAHPLPSTTALAATAATAASAAHRPSAPGPAQGKASERAAGTASDTALSWRDIEHPYAGAERKSQISLSRMAAMKGDKALLTDMLDNAQLSPQELLLVMNAAINGKGLQLVPDIAARGADLNGEGATRGALETMLLKGQPLDRETIEAARYLVSRGAVWKEKSMAQLKDPSTQADIDAKISQLARHGIQVSRIH